MSIDFVSSTTPPNKECGEEEEEEWNRESECEQEVRIGEEVPIDRVEEPKEGMTECEQEVRIGEEVPIDRVEEPNEGMMFDTLDHAIVYYSRYARQQGFAIHKRTSRKGKDGNVQRATLSCTRDGMPKVNKSNPVNPRPQARIGCAARVTVVMNPEGTWRVNVVNLEHNHVLSPSQARFFKSNRVLNEQVKRRLELNDAAGIKTYKTYDSLRIEAGGADMLSFLKKDCRNYLDKQRRLRLVEGDAQAMHHYFMRMKADNSEFFFAMDLDDDGRLKNVFWADARSRAACKEFGDVVTFNTTYLVNKYNMPFAPFVGVNHHGRSTLLGCGLISNEDTESFVWLFQTWKTCMWDCAPKAIITDQCMAMKNAIQEVFPDTRHRWCIWHIMKKVPEKFSSYIAYEKISKSMRATVYDSLTVKEFEDAWDGFIKKYELETNTWLDGLYLERKRWVPAYLKDVFWAGMSSTQRSEGMNAYFDGYIHSKTTLKQFVDQYEIALKDKVEIENEEDAKSLTTFIPLISTFVFEEQFQRAYTNAKFKEFQKQIAGKINCTCLKIKEGPLESEFQVKQLVSFGEGEEKYRKQVPFLVHFNAETNETHCKCRLFEFRGIVCTHQLMVWHEMGIQRVPEKYVLRRWSKNVKRAHTKVRICYDKSSMSIEERRRHDNMCNLFSEVADLAQVSQGKYDMVMKRLQELKQECSEVSNVIQSNAISLGDDEETQRHESFPLGDGVIPPVGSTNILDPLRVTPKGRPREKRLVGIVDKIIAKKRQAKKKPLSNEKSKEGVEMIEAGPHIVDKIGPKKRQAKKKPLSNEKSKEEVEKIQVGHHVGTQESIVNLNGNPSYMAHSMWTNMMPHYVQPNFTQGGSIFPFSPPLCPTGTSLSQYLPSFPNSQSSLNGQFWMGQASLLDSQVVGGEQSSQRSQVWGVGQPSHVWGGQPSQAWGGGQQSFTDMMNETDSGEK